jgi:type VI secretion system protein ImpF
MNNPGLRGNSSHGASQPPRERLRPSLLDRLTDEAPDQRSEAAGQFLASERLYREAVLRDLRWLFNTSSDAPHLDHTGAQTPRHSVLNFGIPPLAGLRMSEIEWHNIEQEIHQAIIAFEPRIIPASLEVRCIPAEEALSHYNLLALRIRGHLHAVPYPLEFLLRSEIDLESGQVNLVPEGA